MCEDNQSSIKMLESKKYTRKTKLIDTPQGHCNNQCIVPLKNYCRHFYETRTQARVLKTPKRPKPKK